MSRIRSDACSTGEKRIFCRGTPHFFGVLYRRHILILIFFVLMKIQVDGLSHGLGNDLHTNQIATIWGLPSAKSVIDLLTPPPPPQKVNKS